MFRTRTFSACSSFSAIALALLPIAVPVVAPTSSSAAAPMRCTDRADGGASVAFGLTADQRVICFKTNRPTVSTTLMSAASLTSPDTTLVGIDVRPATGALYGLGDGGGIYILDPEEKRPQLKSRLNVALEGRFFGMDFNPTVDRLRVVSDRGQNLRVNVDTGATTVDAFVRNGTARANGVGAVAYTNNDNDASTATTLFDLDSLADQLVTQTPPNDGVLNTVGTLGFRGSAEASFDIVSKIVDGKATENTGYAVLDGGGAFFTIDLKTGAAKFIGNFSAGDRLTGLAFPTA